MKESPALVTRTKILAITDKTLFVEQIQPCLTNLGYTAPIFVPSEVEITQTIEEIQPSLILIDVKLRGKAKGIRTAQEIRQRFDATNGREALAV